MSFKCVWKVLEVTLNLLFNYFRYSNFLWFFVQISVCLVNYKKKKQTGFKISCQCLCVGTKCNKISEMISKLKRWLIFNSKIFKRTFFCLTPHLRGLSNLILIHIFAKLMQLWLSQESLSYLISCKNLKNIIWKWNSDIHTFSPYLFKNLVCLRNLIWFQVTNELKLIFSRFTENKILRKKNYFS